MLTEVKEIDTIYRLESMIGDLCYIGDVYEQEQCAIPIIEEIAHSHEAGMITIEARILLHKLIQNILY